MSKEREMTPALNGQVQLEIAKLLGEPINAQLPVPVELREIADVDTAEPGDKVYRIKNLDETADIVLDVDSNGDITVVKRTALDDVELTFKGLNSKLEYVLVDDIINKVDVDALARRKESITRGMDKTELKLILDALITPTNTYFPHNEVNNNEVAVASGDDLYDVIMAMKHVVEDYGDNFMLLAGTTVKEKLDTYHKDNVTSFNYKISIIQELKDLAIDVMKIFGKVSRVTGETESRLLDQKKMLLVARNSRIAEGKPIAFVRRRISADIARQMGADVDSAQRAVYVNPTPVVDAGTNKLGFGVQGYESVIFCVKNPYGISYADVSSII